MPTCGRQEYHGFWPRCPALLPPLQPEGGWLSRSRSSDSDLPPTHPPTPHHPRARTALDLPAALDQLQCLGAPAREPRAGALIQKELSQARRCRPLPERVLRCRPHPATAAGSLDHLALVRVVGRGTRTSFFASAGGSFSRRCFSTRAPRAPAYATAVRRGFVAGGVLIYVYCILHTNVL